MNSRSVAIFAVVVAVLVAISVYYLNSPLAPHQPDLATTTPTPMPAPRPTNELPVEPRLTQSPKPPPGRVPKVAAPVPAQPAEPITEDNLKISRLLDSVPGDTDADHDKAAAMLINLLPSLGKDAQVECAQHITDLLSDAQYARVLPIWRNAAANPDVLEVIGDDLNNRANKVKMNAWIDAVRNPSHPYHEEAKNNLEVYLDEDYSGNIPKLEKAVKTFLDNEAKEEAGAEK